MMISKKKKTGKNAYKNHFGFFLCCLSDVLWTLTFLCKVSYFLEIDHGRQRLSCHLKAGTFLLSR